MNTYNAQCIFYIHSTKLETIQIEKRESTQTIRNKLFVTKQLPLQKKTKIKCLKFLLAEHRNKMAIAPLDFIDFSRSCLFSSYTQ
jgi:hypothetical protein